MFIHPHIQSAVYNSGILTSFLNAGNGTTNLLYGATLACLLLDCRLGCWDPGVTKTGSRQAAAREEVKMEFILLLSIIIEPKAAGSSLVKTSCFSKQPQCVSRSV